MILSVKSQAEGVAATTTRKARAYASISTARYTGRGRFSFDQYIGKHQKSHNDLADMDESVAETKKVTDFLHGITDNTLMATKQIILGDNVKLTNFEACQQYLKTVIENMKVTKSDDDTTRRVSSLRNENGRDRANKRGDGKKGKPNKKDKPRVHGGHYERDEWHDLSEEERAKVLDLRTKKKAAKRSISAVMSEPEDTTAVATSPTKPAAATNKKVRVDETTNTTKIINLESSKEATGAEDPATKKAPEAEASSQPQFGRKAHKE